MAQALKVNFPPEFIAAVKDEFPNSEAMDSALRTGLVDSVSHMISTTLMNASYRIDTKTGDTDSAAERIQAMRGLQKRLRDIKQKTA